MPIAVTANSLPLAITEQAAACFSHHTRSAAVQLSLSHEVTNVQRVIDFSILDLGGSPLGQSSPKGEMTYYSPRSTILQNFNPIAQTVYEICVTEVFPLLGQSLPKGSMTWQTIRSTILQILIALRQPTSEISLTKNPEDTHRDTQKHRYTNSKRYVPSMPIGMWR